MGQTELPDEAWQLAVDAHDRAVRDLVAFGLLRRDGDSVIPTRAAVRFHELHG